jgi:hypothetical protein
MDLFDLRGRLVEDDARYKRSLEVKVVRRAGDLHWRP